MPPQGGFEAIKYKRNLPFRGPGSLVILGGVTGICGYGFYRLGKGNLERRYEPILSPARRGPVGSHLDVERGHHHPARHETWCIGSGRMCMSLSIT